MSNPRDFHDGGCACGHVRYRVSSGPLIVHCCHCSLCQRQTGSAFVVNALMEADRIALLQGEVTEDELPTPSGKNQRVARCVDCRVTLWSCYLAVPDIGELIRFIRVGTLDDPDQMPPDVHIYTSSKLSWVSLPPGCLAVKEFYVTEEVWSSDSLARRALLLEIIRAQRSSF